MKGFFAALSIESLKSRRSWMLWIILAIFVFMAFMMGLMIYLSLHPELIHNSDLLTAKTSIFENVDWSAYFKLLYEIVAMIGLIGFGFVFSWFFGREYTDHTIKDLLALPMPRSTIVMAKMTVAFFWCIMLSLTLFVAGIASGFLIHISGWTGDLAWKAFGIYAVTALLTMLVSTPIAFFACWGQGFMLPLGYMILMMIITQFVGNGIPALAPYFPWAVPALYCFSQGLGGPPVETASYVIFGFTSLLGIVITMAWWRYADQK
jgi:ABC-2 type transport system permease protein